MEITANTPFNPIELNSLIYKIKHKMFFVGNSMGFFSHCLARSSISIVVSFFDPVVIPQDILFNSAQSNHGNYSKYTVQPN